MSDIKIKNKTLVSEFSDEDLVKMSDIIVGVQDKAVSLNQIHDGLGVARMENIFHLENTELTDDEKEILKGKYN